MARVRLRTRSLRLHDRARRLAAAEQLLCRAIPSGIFVSPTIYAMLSSSVSAIPRRRRLITLTLVYLLATSLFLPRTIRTDHTRRGGRSQRLQLDQDLMLPCIKLLHLRLGLAQGHRVKRIMQLLDVAYLCTTLTGAPQQRGVHRRRIKRQ
eukprot:6178206-Pleurochrysis_carterae.AAC.4